jgi:phosphatidylglycerophosphate synthase
MNQQPTKVGDRRPIPAREHQLSKKIASWLANMGAGPNSISIFGMIAGIVSGLCYAATSWSDEHHAILFIVGAVFVFLRLLANMFDGMVALILAKPNPLGEIFNDAPDRVSDCAILIGCGFSINSSPTAGFYAALFAMMTAYIRAIGKCSGAPQSFLGPMAKQQRMFLCIAVSIACALIPGATAMIYTQFDGSPVAYSIMGPTLWFIAAGSAYTCIRRLAAISADLKSK